MQYRQYGSTGKNVSLIGLGTAKFSPEPTHFDRNVEMVLDAIKLGINYFDTAYMYAYGVSDKVIGTAFNQYKNENARLKQRDLYVSAKSLLSADPDSDAVRRRIDAALNTLCVGKITFFHMWSILNLEQYRGIIAPGGPLDGARKAREEGLIEHICFSAHCGGDEISQILDDGYFDGVTLGFNAINYRHRIDGLKKAAAMGLGTAIMNPLGGGLIPKNPGYFGYIQSDGMSLIESAVQFIAAHSEVSTILIGAENIGQLKETAQAIEKPNYTAIEWEDKVSSAPEQKLQLCTTCNYCRGCPAELDVRQIMNVYNQYILSDFDKEHYYEHRRMFLGLDKYESIGCAGCGKCEKKCTQHLPIIERIKAMNDISREETEQLDLIIKRHFPVTGYPNTGIYGLSVEAGAVLMRIISTRGKLPEGIYFFDTNSAKWGTSVMGTEHTVHPPAEIRELNVTRILITAAKYEKEITAFLEDYTDEDTEISLF